MIPLPFCPVFSRTALAFLAVLLFSTGALALKPAHEANRLAIAARDAINDDNYTRAEEYLNEIRRLGAELPPDYNFLYGKLLHQQGNLSRARARLEQYVDRAGTGGRDYDEALSLITAIEESRGSKPSARSGSNDGGTAEIRWADDGEGYVGEIQNLYQVADPGTALATHINSLLKFYAYGDKRIIAASRMGTPSQHRIQVGEGDELVSLHQFGATDSEASESSEDRFSVYGVNPYVKYQCSAAAGNCWLIHPVTLERWIQIVKNEEAAKELSRAFSHLIRTMQKTR